MPARLIDEIYKKDKIPKLKALKQSMLQRFYKLSGLNTNDIIV